MPGGERGLISQLPELRERLHLSQEELARRLGVSFSTVNRWERGHATPSRSSLARLERFFRDTAAADSAPARSLRLHRDPRPFIGRSEELAELMSLWRSCRMLTLTGLGGIGKSRLAAELLLRSESPVLGVARLDAVRDPALTSEAVEMALAVPRHKPGAPEWATIVAALQRRKGVLFLDTCEHVAASLRELLRRILIDTRAVQILATSQIPLDVPGEQVWRVPGLRLPGQPAEREPRVVMASGPGIQEAAECDAARFFLARAREHAPGFTPEGKASQDVIAICRQLDGIPLALGLAAGLMATMAPADLLERWDARAELLSDPGPEHERHRTLMSAIQWSAALLSRADQQLVALVSAFTGPCTVADIGAIAPDLTSAALLAAIHRLVSSSWLEFSGTPEPGHYRMLDPVRTWGLQRLMESGQAEPARRRHAKHFRTLCRRAEADRFRADLGDWPQRLKLASGNIQGALAWCADTDPELGTELVVSLLGWWRRSGRLAEGRHWSRMFRESSAAELSRARAGCAEALLAMDIGDYGDTGRLAAQALRVLESHHDTLWTGRAYTALSSAAKYRGDARGARAYLENALTHQQPHGDQYELASTLNNLGSLTADQRDLAAAERYYRLSLAAKSDLGDNGSIALTMANLADVHRMRGESAVARGLLDDAMNLAVPLGNDFLIAFIRINLGENFLSEGDHDAARDAFGKARAYAAHSGATRFQALAACGLGKALCALGKNTAGQRRLQESRRIAQKMGDEILMDEVRAALAQVSMEDSPSPLAKPLTRQETHILEHAGRGLSNAQIAQQLGVSPGTVQRHLANIYKKLKVHNRTEATARAWELGLLQRPDRRTLRLAGSE